MGTSNPSTPGSLCMTTALGCCSADLLVCWIDAWLTIWSASSALISGKVTEMTFWLAVQFHSRRPLHQRSGASESFSCIRRFFSAGVVPSPLVGLSVLLSVKTAQYLGVYDDWRATSQLRALVSLGRVLAKGRPPAKFGRRERAIDSWIWPAISWSN